MRPSSWPARPSLRRCAEAALLITLAGGCAPRTAPPAAPPLDPALPRTEPLVRVGMLVDTPTVALSAPGGLRIADASTEAPIATVASGAPVVFSADPGGLIRYQAPGAPVAETRSRLVALEPSAPADPINIGGKPYRGGALIRGNPGGRVTAINRLPMESYLLGVVPREIGAVGDTLIEAAKAQAVAARTYAIRYLDRRAELGFDVFATVQDQAYGGIEAEHPPVSEAVRGTAGEILTYAGKPIEAFYHSTCAGRTAAIEEVWDEPPRPYLTSVVDVDPATGLAYDRRSNRFTWTVRWTADELERILSRTLADSLPAGAPDAGELRDVTVLERTPSGRIRALRISTTRGDFVVGGDRIRWIFETPEGRILNSSKFDVSLERDPAGRVQAVTATGGGWGHGIGMCQVGAMGRAMAGQDYRRILEAYYTGARVRKLY